MKNIITEEMFDYYKPTFDIELHDVGKIMYVKYDYEHPHLPQDRDQMWEIELMVGNEVVEECVEPKPILIL